MAKYIIILFVLALPVVTEGQRNVKEQVYMHLSGADLLVGETLYFSAFVRSQATGELSDLSKFLYVELLDEEGQLVHQTKLALDGGRGAGKYFISSLTTTGVYHLTAYTRWMRNWGEYFHTSLHVVNPYEEPKELDGQDELVVQFFPSGGQLVAAVENTLLMHISKGGHPVAIKGRLVSGQNEGSVATIATDSEGFAEVRFTPNPTSNYRMILEGEAGFEFVDLPSTCLDCAKLEHENRNDQHTFRLRSGPQYAGGDMQLVLESPQEVILSRPCGEDETIEVPAATLPAGLTRALLLRGTDTLSQQIFWVGDVPAPAQSTQIEAAASFRNVITRKLKIPGGSKVSLSVRRQDGIFLQSEDIASRVLVGQLKKKVDIRELKGKKANYLLATSEWGSTPLSQDGVRLLPEYRSDLIEGVVTNLSMEAEADVSIGLSVPSRPYQLRVRSSDENGTFLVDYDSELRMDRGVLKVFENDLQRSVKEGDSQVIDPQGWLPSNASMRSMDIDGRFRVHVLNEFYGNYPKNLSYTPMILDTIRVEKIIERSVYNQIENAYYEDTPDTLVVGLPQLYGFKSYVLDDFTRFQTMRDTFIEIVATVGVSKNEENFKINLHTDTDFEHRKAGGETILLIDGVLVTSEAILSISPFLVRRIDVLNKKYFFGDKMFDGVVSVHTFGGEAWDAPTKNRQVELIPVQPTPQAEESPAPTDQRHADYRTLLSWQPLLTVPGNGELEVAFQTSDVPGTYRMEINGVTMDGSPIAIKEILTVGSVPAN